MLSPWSDIGTSAMSGGAINWGSLWSGVKNFGSSLKNIGVKTWNSSAAQALKNKLKETKVQEKIIEGINAGVHGALDIARQELDKKIAAKLDQPVPIPEVEVEEPPPPEETIAPPLPPKKRPMEENDLIIRTEEPPSYDSLYPDKSPAPPLVSTPASRPTPIPAPRQKPIPPPRKLPTTRPHPSMVTPVVTPAVPPPTAADIPITLDEPRPLGPLRNPTIIRPSRNNWQSTLNSIVGLGVRSVKRRRCY